MRSIVASVASLDDRHVSSIGETDRADPPDLARVGTGSPMAEPFAIGHLPISHPSFGRWRPEVVALAVVDPEELLGYEEWKLAKGGFF